MTPFVQDTDFTLYVGDVREVLAGLPDESVQCVVTSPPYWGLRDYGTGSWDGGNPDCDHVQAVQRPSDNSTLQDHGDDGRSPQLDALPGIPFRETCGKCGATRIDQQLGLEPTPELYVENMVSVFREVRRVMRRDATLWLNLGDAFQDKQLLGMPWRIAFALQADGWYLRSEIIWAKPNPMPESVTDRPTKAHEQVFLLTRSPRYFFDQEAVREPYLEPERVEARYREGFRSETTATRYVDHAVDPRRGARGPDGRRKTTVKKGDGSIQHRDGERWPNGGRNIRSVWEIPTQPFAEAHFATYPQALVERCVKAGTKDGDVVLDPFLGSGTTALVARRLSRRSIGIELNPEYADMAAKRLSQLSLLA